MARKAPNGLDLVNTKIVNLADGTGVSDAATWGQVQAFLAGLAWKTAVRAASTANVTLASPGASMDGVTLAANDRVLLKNQTAGAENGIYVWSASGSALVRATDMDVAAETKAATVLVQEGTANHDTAWTQTADAVTLGTTSLVFAQFGGGAVYTAGNGLQLSVGAFSILLDTASGLVVSGTGLKIDTAVVTRKFSQAFGGSTSNVITHNLGTLDVQVTVFDVATGDEEMPDVNHTSINTVTLNYAVAPGASAKRVVVQG